MAAPMAMTTQTAGTNQNVDRSLSRTRSDETIEIRPTPTCGNAHGEPGRPDNAQRREVGEDLGRTPRILLPRGLDQVGDNSLAPRSNFLRVRSGEPTIRVEQGELGEGGDASSSVIDRTHVWDARFESTGHQRRRAFAHLGVPVRRMAKAELHD